MSEIKDEVLAALYDEQTIAWDNCNKLSAETREMATVMHNNDDPPDGCICYFCSMADKLHGLDLRLDDLRLKVATFLPPEYFKEGSRKARIRRA